MTSFKQPLDTLFIAKDILLTPFNLDEAKLLKTLGMIFTRKIDYTDLYFQFIKSESWSLEEGIVKNANFSIEQGVGVRAISGDKTAFSYSDEISDSILHEAALATRTISQQGATGQTKIMNSLQQRNNRSLYLSYDPLASLDAASKIAILERIEFVARAQDPRVVQVIANLSGEYSVVLITRNDGVITTDIRPLVQISIMVIVQQNGRRETGSSGGGCRGDYTYFNDALLKKYALEAVSIALINLDARAAPAGLMCVVLGPGWPGVLLHEAVGHGLEADFNRKGSSVFSNRIGHRVAAKGVTVVDDGTLPDRRGSLNIDDEGNYTECTVLIENGVLKNYMQDAMNARLMNMPVTGNGRRESFAHLPMPRMTNTYMLSGDKTHNEIISSVKNGLYAVNFSGGQVDITNGKFVFSANEAYMIENGKITYPVKGATLIGDGPDILHKIALIGNDMKLDPGVGICGKDGQNVPVGVGQPTLLLDSITVGGIV